MTRTIFTLSALLLTATIANAQVPATPRTPVTPQTPTTPQTQVTPAGQQQSQAPTPYRVKQILGATVNLTSGEKVGTVDDIVLSEDGQVEYLIVSENNRLATVPWQAAKFDLNTRTAALEVTTEKYRTAPRYDTNTYPEFYTPEYRNQVYGYYGLTPREIRRAILPRRR